MDDRDVGDDPFLSVLEDQAAVLVKLYDHLVKKLCEHARRVCGLVGACNLEGFLLIGRVVVCKLQIFPVGLKAHRIIPAGVEDQDGAVCFEAAIGFQAAHSHLHDLGAARVLIDARVVHRQAVGVGDEGAVGRGQQGGGDVERDAGRAVGQVIRLDAKGGESAAGKVGEHIISEAGLDAHGHAQPGKVEQGGGHAAAHLQGKAPGIELLPLVWDARQALKEQVDVDAARTGDKRHGRFLLYAFRKGALSAKYASTS